MGGGLIKFLSSSWGNCGFKKNKKKCCVVAKLTHQIEIEEFWREINILVKNTVCFIQSYKRSRTTLIFGKMSRYFMEFQRK